MPFVAPSFSEDEWEEIYGHISNFKAPRYTNMHLRQAHIVNKKRTLRYLHIMKKAKDGEIQGMISGPKDLFVHYKITMEKSRRINFQTINYSGEEKDLNRVSNKLKSEIIRRIQEEIKNKDNNNHPSPLAGEFYLKRWNPGSSADSDKCVKALSEKILSKQFVGALFSWKFLLYQGKPK